MKRERALRIMRQVDEALADVKDTDPDLVMKIVRVYVAMRDTGAPHVEAVRLTVATINRRIEIISQ